MTTAILVAISLMWLPVALFYLGKGEARGTGFICGLVGISTVVSAILQAAVFKDPFTGGLLFAHGLFYLSVAHALITGAEDMRSVGNVSLTVALISTVYAIVFFAGSSLVPKNNYLALACLGYAVITYEVWLNAYGKFPARGVAWSLIIWVVMGLWVPAFWLMTSGTLPF